MTYEPKEYYAVGKYIRLSTDKSRRVLKQITGKKYKEARIALEFMPYKAAKIIVKILDSALSNMMQQNKNSKPVNKENITIASAYANRGPVLKRLQPRAQGRAFPIHKPTCHITMKLREK